jgi:putative addiction module component (TIGR02574 family)
MKTLLAQEVDKLSPDEKMHLAADLWDEVAAYAAALPVPVEHQRILDARLSAHEANPASALSLEEFQRQLAATQS